MKEQDKKSLIKILYDCIDTLTFGPTCYKGSDYKLDIPLFSFDLGWQDYERIKNKCLADLHDTVISLTNHFTYHFPIYWRFYIIELESTSVLIKLELYWRKK